MCADVMVVTGTAAARCVVFYSDFYYAVENVMCPYTMLRSNLLTLRSDVVDVLVSATGVETTFVNRLGEAAVAVVTVQRYRRLLLALARG